MRKKSAIAIPQIKTLEEADAHQRKHGFPPLVTPKEQRLASVHNSISGLRPRKLRGPAVVKMNKTEREFSVLLEARKRAGGITDYRFAPAIRLMWGDGMFYKPDFAALRPDLYIELLEVKGPHIFDRDIVRFKGCRAEWKDWFVFEMHQRDKEGRWSRLL